MLTNLFNTDLRATKVKIVLIFSLSLGDSTSHPWPFMGSQLRLKKLSSRNAKLWFSYLPPGNREQFFVFQEISLLVLTHDMYTLVAVHQAMKFSGQRDNRVLQQGGL